MPLPSVDNDVKEAAAVSIDGTSREEEMWRWSLEMRSN
jgi:hypothetical protein